MMFTTQNSKDVETGHYAVQLQVRRDTGSVRLIRNYVETVCQRLPWTDSLLDDIKLAVGEACNNAVLYTPETSGAQNDWLTVRCQLCPDSVEIDITTPGNFFQPKATPMPDPLALGGRGYALMHDLMDSVEYVQTNQGTIVRLRKFRPLSA